MRQNITYNIQERVYIIISNFQRKYIRFDDTSYRTGRYVYTLLTRHWGLRPPDMVISIIGGDIVNMYEDKKLHNSFRNGIIKTAVNTSTLISMID